MMRCHLILLVILASTDGTEDETETPKFWYGSSQ